MAPKVFLTGATGYVGGNVLFALVEAHPDWEYTCLVRNADKGAKVAASYPKIRLVYGTLDSTDLLEEEAGKADIVYHTAESSDHVASAEAFAKAAAKRAPSSPLFYIHTSGTGVLGWETTEKNAYGTELPRIYNDWDGIKELTSIPDSASHRDVDKIVLRMSSTNPQAVKTAIVCPPCIYGPGRGPDNQRSIQVYEAAKAILERKQAFLPLKGENVWHEVNVDDLSDLFKLLGEAAAAGGGKATWNEDGYYFAEHREFVWKDIFQSIAKIAKQKGLIESDETPSLPADELTKLHPAGLYIWASNSRGKAIRARKLLGWECRGKSLKEDLPEIVEREARALGLIEGHAAKVTK
ncbi:hypothetical protein GJ744_000022 [Endocarpon pusillum]|uniref:NAD-dependent epimerase/dehydratase domain-containing protein n=1 Tax=Endocarpon pusillum TaxID=364733 RepID=A0A8H7AWM7_9EURO|nr:hypothetical protein GJ744_000022 [Endocarpon pusillum]